jgi:hypothetical protein
MAHSPFSKASSSAKSPTLQANTTEVQAFEVEKHINGSKSNHISPPEKVNPTSNLGTPTIVRQFSSTPPTSPFVPKSLFTINCNDNGGGRSNGGSSFSSGWQGLRALCTEHLAKLGLERSTCAAESWKKWEQSQHHESHLHALQKGSIECTDVQGETEEHLRRRQRRVNFEKYMDKVSRKIISQEDADWAIGAGQTASRACSLPGAVNKENTPPGKKRNPKGSRCRGSHLLPSDVSCGVTHHEMIIGLRLRPTSSPAGHLLDNNHPSPPQRLSSSATASTSLSPQSRGVKGSCRRFGDINPVVHNNIGWTPASAKRHTIPANVLAYRKRIGAGNAAAKGLRY